MLNHKKGPAPRVYRKDAGPTHAEPHFRTVLRGYDEVEVLTYLDEVQSEFDRELKKRDQLLAHQASQIKLLKAAVEDRDDYVTALKSMITELLTRIKDPTQN